MIKIGEKLNSSLEAARELMARRDGDALAALAQRQLDAGADYLDINAALFMRQEAEVLAWAVQAVQRKAGARLMIDSSDPSALAAALQADREGFAIVNSVTPDAARMDAVAPLLRQYGASVVALCMDEGGIPPSAEGRAGVAERSLELLGARGIPPERVFVDPLVEALASNHDSAAITLKAIRLICERWPGVNIVCGLSNVSFGLPKRRAVNTAFITAAIAMGLNAAILDVTDGALMQAVAAAEAVAGKDEYCMGYIRFCREND